MFKRYYLTVTIALITGCVSQVVTFKEHINSWVGRPIHDYIEVRNKGNVDRAGYKGTQRVFKNKSENFVYEFPYALCSVFFEVNNSSIIVTVYTEGNKDCQ